MQLEYTPKQLARFWQYVDTSGDCWTWTGGLQGPMGYGLFHHGMFDGVRRRLAAHRASWEIHHGPIPLHTEVCHRCDNPLCVRPDHLFLGSHDDNMRDATVKGRVNRGEQRALAKLTEIDVREIRARCAAGELQYRLATEFGVNKSVICEIISRKSWKHVG